MRIVAVFALLLVWTGCAVRGTGPEASGRGPDASEPDHVAPLAAQLPRGADRCALVRPTLLSAELRSLYAPVAQAGPLAWIDGVEVLAYASAERERRRHAPATVILLRVASADTPALRRLVAQRSGLDLRWDVGDVAECTPEECPTGARFVEPGLIRIERGAWPHVAREGAEVACRRLATSAPGALELRASRRRDGDVGRKLGLPLRSTTRVHPLERGVRLVRDDLMVGGDHAELLLSAGEGAPDARPFGDITVKLSRTRRDSVVHTEAEALWDDLRLAREDDERHALADAYADALERVVPAGDVDFADAARLEEQARLRLTLVRASTASDPGPLVAEAQSFIEQALAARPAEPALTALRVRLSLDYLDDAPGALALAEQQLQAAEPTDSLRRLRREAAARVSLDRLSAALVEDGLIDTAHAREAAKRIRAEFTAGSNYAEVEHRALGRR